VQVSALPTPSNSTGYINIAEQDCNGIVSSDMGSVLIFITILTLSLQLQQFRALQCQWSWWSPTDTNCD